MDARARPSTPQVLAEWFYKFANAFHQKPLPTFFARTALLTLAAMATGPSPCFARTAYHVDTGPGPNNVDPAQTKSARLAGDQWLGFTLDIARPATIRGIEGWMAIIPGGEGTGRVTLRRKDENNLPGTLIFSATFYGAVTDPTGAYSIADWVGTLALKWKVKPGSYWITFESDGSPGGLVAGFLLPSADPVQMEAYRPCCVGTAWVSASLGLGVRVREKVPGTPD